MLIENKWDKVFKNGQTAFKKFYLIHSWILSSKYYKVLWIESQTQIWAKNAKAMYFQSFLVFYLLLTRGTFSSEHLLIRIFSWWLSLILYVLVTNHSFHLSYISQTFTNDRKDETIFNSSLLFHQLHRLLDINQVNIAKCSPLYIVTRLELGNLGFPA